ncbi:MAG: ATP synthase F1 subunit delta [Clostridia bacterium]|nr:ATP synthase F1 subunit delta [Clostridia bacterium]
MTEMSKEYASALFSVSLEGGVAQEVADGLAVILAAMRENPAYIELLASPGIPMAERVSALRAAFAAAVPEYALSFVALLTEKGRIREIFDCAEAYNDLHTAYLQSAVAHVVSAVPLTDEEKTKLVARLSRVSGKQIRAEYEVDEGIMGGLVVSIDGKVMDGSVRHRLQEIKGVMNDECKA